MLLPFMLKLLHFENWCTSEVYDPQAKRGEQRYKNWKGGLKYLFADRAFKFLKIELNINHFNNRLLNPTENGNQKLAKMDL